ncbi:hypothetical protein BFF78_10385 [Streptomyces fodineus]|uniref:Uncharacterized protein n=1 Tax=Streptomyces fodineus TaxID=1904616 RepID=A0A1D7Y7F2_9ACTN|nr:hypothetical protein BFF78_10385 [Streptomyces fodineus]
MTIVYGVQLGVLVGQLLPTVAAVGVRALGDPDVAPPGVEVPGGWRPWRSYAVQHLRVVGEGGR